MQKQCIVVISEDPSLNVEKESRVQVNFISCLYVHTLKACTYM